MSKILTESEWKDEISKTAEFKEACHELRSSHPRKTDSEGYVVAKRVKVGNELVDIFMNTKTLTFDPVYVETV